MLALDVETSRKAMGQSHHRLCEAILLSAFIGLISGAAFGQAANTLPGFVIPPPNAIHMIQPGLILPSVAAVPVGVTVRATAEPALTGRVSLPLHIVHPAPPPAVPPGFVVREIIPGMSPGPGVPNIPPGTTRVVSPPGG